MSSLAAVQPETTALSHIDKESSENFKSLFNSAHCVPCQFGTSVA